MTMSATQNPQPVSKRLRLTSRGSAVDSPSATVVDALEFDLTREDSSVEGERDDIGDVRASHCQVGDSRHYGGPAEYDSTQSLAGFAI